MFVCLGSRHVMLSRNVKRHEEGKGVLSSSPCPGLSQGCAFNYIDPGQASTVRHCGGQDLALMGFGGCRNSRLNPLVKGTSPVCDGHRNSVTEGAPPMSAAPKSALVPDFPPQRALSALARSFQQRPWSNRARSRGLELFARLRPLPLRPKHGLSPRLVPASRAADWLLRGRAG